MYQVLYRKWRPLSFSDVSGQEQVTVTLKNELKTNRINHAYLFTGSRGTGKTTCAKILAKAVNCLNPIDGDPCGECENCLGIESGEILDVLEIDAASNNGVENIRSLIEESVFAPTRAKFRVYIIDEVHMLSIGAFNALLKTLEEPPAHVVFILATTEVHKIPATILSRCQRFNFNKISADSIAKRLIYVCENENTTIDYDASFLIASLSDGALRDALSLLDRCIGSNTHVTTDIVRQISGLASKEYLFSIIESVIKRDCTNPLTIIDSLNNNSKDMSKLCEELISHFRNLMLIKTMKNARELVILTDSEFESALVHANNLSVNEIIYAMDTLQSSLEKMHRGANKRTEIEVALIKICSPKFDTSTDALISRIAYLERAIKNGVVVSTTQQNSNDDIIKKDNSNYQDKKTIDAENSNAPKEQTTEINEFDVDISTPTTNTVEKTPTKAPVQTVSANTHPVLAKAQEENSKPSPVRQSAVTPNFEELVKNARPMSEWQDVLDILNQKSKSISSAFNSTTAYISGDFLLIDSKYEITFKLLRDSCQRDQVKLAIKEVTGRAYRLGPYKMSANGKKKDDPLDELTKKLKDAGITLTESDNI